MRAWVAANPATGVHLEASSETRLPSVAALTTVAALASEPASSLCRDDLVQV